MGCAVLDDLDGCDACSVEVWRWVALEGESVSGWLAEDVEVPLVGPASWMRGVAGCAGCLGPVPSKWEESMVEGLSSGAGEVECAVVSERASSSLSRLVATVAPPPTSTATPAAARKLEVIAPEAPAAAAISKPPTAVEVPVAVAAAGAVGTADAAWARAAVAADITALPPAIAPKIKPAWCLLAALCA